MHFESLKLIAPTHDLNSEKKSEKSKWIDLPELGTQHSFYLWYTVSV